jgi:hypothetical protein
LALGDIFQNQRPTGEIAQKILFRLPGLDRRTELLDGVIIDMEPVSPWHANIGDILLYILICRAALRRARENDRGPPRAAAISTIIAKSVRCISLRAGGPLQSVNTFSVENRTRTYQPRQGVHFRRGTFDDQFDCQLPEEARTELLGEIPPPNPCRSRKIPYRPAPPPAKRLGGAAVIGAIAIVALFLYAVSRTDGPSTFTAPPESRSVLPPLPSQPVEVRRALPVEVRRALPTALRALPINSVPSVVPTVGWQSIRMLDGSIIPVHYEGELPSSAALPSQGRFIGEEYSTGNTSWIWTQPAGTNVASWVDP